MITAPIVGAGLVGVALPLALWGASAPRVRHSTPGENLRRGMQGPIDLHDLELQESAVDRLVAPVISRLARVARRITPRGAADRVEQRLSAAGVQWPIERFYAAKQALLAVTAVFSVLWVVTSPGIGTLLMAMVVTASGWLGPDIVLSQRADKRAVKLRNELPDTIDQIMIAVEAGLAFEGAIARVAASGDGALNEELNRTLQDIQLGVPRHEALEGLAKRTGLGEMNRFVAAVRQSEQYGVPIVNVLRSQASELRERRRQRAEERAMKIPVKVVMPLVFCILPALFIVVLGPAAVDLRHGLFGNR